MVFRHKLDGKSEGEKHDPIRSQLVGARAPEAWGKVTRMAGASPKDVKPI